MRYVLGYKMKLINKQKIHPNYVCPNYLIDPGLKNGSTYWQNLLQTILKSLSNRKIFNTSNYYC